MRLIAVGVDGATRDLLRALGDRWQVAVLDADPVALEMAERSRDVDVVHGDVTDPMTLLRAGLDDADAVLASLGDDDANLAVCRTAKEAGVPSITALAADPERLPDYREIDVAAWSPHRMAARRIETALEPRRVSAAGFAGGAAEALEFRVAGDSPVRGRMLAQLRAETWLVVAILRGGELVIPHGRNRLQAGDLVTIVGPADSYADIVRTFTAGEARFPLDYGQAVAVLLDPHGERAAEVVGEALHLAQVSLTPELLIMHPHPRGLGAGAARRLDQVLAAAREAPGLDVRSIVAADPAEAAFDDQAGDHVGVVVTAPPEKGLLAPWRGTADLIRRARRRNVPLLVARGTQPYDSVVISLYDRPSQWAAAAAAVDLAARGNTRLVAAAVRPPSFVAAHGAEHAERFGARLREEAAVRGVAMRRVEREGNPVRALAELAGRRSLLVAGMPDRDPAPWRLGTVGHLVRSAEASVLLVPTPHADGGDGT